MGYSIRDRLTKDFYVPLYAGLDGAERALPFNVYAPYTNVGGTAQGPGGIGQGDGGYDTPVDSTIDEPNIGGDVCGNSEVEIDAVLTADAFGSSNGQTLVAARWMVELLSDEGDLGIAGTGIIVYDSGVKYTNPTQLDLDPLNLKPGYSYRVRMRYKGSNQGWSDWSAWCAFAVTGCYGETLVWFDLKDHNSFNVAYPGAGSTAWTHITNKGTANIQLKRSGGTGDLMPAISPGGSPTTANPWPGDSIAFNEGALLVTTADTDTAIDYAVDKVTMFFVGSSQLDTGDYRAFTWHDKDRYVDIGSNEFGFHSTPASSRGFVNMYTGWGGDQASLEGPNLGTGQHTGVIAVTVDMTNPDGITFAGKLWYNGVQVCPGVSCAENDLVFDAVDNPTFNLGALDAGGVSTHGGGYHQFGEFIMYSGILDDELVVAKSEELKLKWGIA